MAISNELSSEIASAILGENRSPEELTQLKKIILEVHSALQQMSHLEKERRVQKLPAIKSAHETLKGF